jgi:hypothetical protein
MKMSRTLTTSLKSARVNLNSSGSMEVRTLGGVIPTVGLNGDGVTDDDGRRGEFSLLLL